MQKMILATGMILVSSSAIAESHWQFSLAGGTAALDTGTVEMRLSSTQDNNLIQNNDDQWKAGTGQVGLGYVIPLWKNSHWFPSIEPQFNYYYLKGNIHGHVDRYHQHNIDCDDVDYQMDLISNRLMLDVALTIVSYEVVSLYGIVGIGSSWNHIDFAQEEDQYYPAVALQAQTDSNFAYEVGAGLSLEIIEDVALTAEYLYAAFDDVSLKNTQAISSDDFNIHSQAILLGFSIAF